MREPRFWHGPSSWKSHLLRPLAALYGAVAARRLRRQGFDAGIPVLCVGNYHVGGAGKTPTVLALAKILRDARRDAGRAQPRLWRATARTGHGRPCAASGRDVGDEPLMMSQDVPVAVARNRIDGVALAKSQRASVILMDDGFQNPSVAKDASLIVIDSERGLGNGRVLPAGPLRAPLKPQLARTDALVVVGDGGASADVASRRHRQRRPGVCRAAQAG